MAKHSITVIHRTVNSSSKTTSTRGKTSGTNKKGNSGVSKKNKFKMLINQPNLMSFVKNTVGISSAYAALELAKQGINIYATINAAATGEEIRNSNLKAYAGALVNPFGFSKDVAKQSFLGNLRTQRINQSLEYQRQLTGNLVYSKSFKNGTF